MSNVKWVAPAVSIREQKNGSWNSGTRESAWTSKELILSTSVESNTVTEENYLRQKVSETAMYFFRTQKVMVTGKPRLSEGWRLNFVESISFLKIILQLKATSATHVASNTIYIFQKLTTTESTCLALQFFSIPPCFFRAPVQLWNRFPFREIRPDLKARNDVVTHS
jgi:hypothetical protein